MDANELSISFDDILALMASSETPLSSMMEIAEKFSAKPMIQHKAAIHRAWIAGHQDDPYLYVAYYNYGMLCFNNKQFMDAREALLAAIRTNPDFFPAYVNLGSVYEEAGEVGLAIEIWQSVAARLGQITPENINLKTVVLKQVGRVQQSRVDLAASEAALTQCIEISGSQRDVMQHITVLRQRQCKWPVIVPMHNISSEQLLRGLAPLAIGTYMDDPLLQLANAVSYNRNDVGWPDQIYTSGTWIPPQEPRTAPLRIGYLSSDLRHHAIGFLMSEVFELHDRANVEVFVYYCGPNLPDSFMQRIKDGVDHWVDIFEMSDNSAAVRLLEDKIDILVDINGYTNFARTKLLSMKPAPIIVNWLGYPGTMGSPYHNYIISDEYIIPEKYELFYTERVMRLPCYQPNDRKRVVSSRPFSRTEAGLPEQAVVYCCFNGLQKVTPAIFDCWTMILHHVPESVLWLLSDVAEAQANIRQRALERGIDPERIVFAGWAMNADHLARYQLADVILDTWPYGAHTTASDALWMGIPIVTLSGLSFASRVCGSLARAAGVPDLVCETREQYMGCAIQLGRDKETLESYKTFLRANRDRCTLFDTPGLVRSLEGLYATMWEEYRSGNLHQPDLNNLAVYEDIGVELQRDGVTYKTDEEYFDLYRRRLAYRHSFSPVSADIRLWREAAATVV